MCSQRLQEHPCELAGGNGSAGPHVAPGLTVSGIGQPMK
jgi:hypothetical protein